MKLVGLGCDLVCQPRIARLLLRHPHSFPSKILSEQELKVYSRLPGALQPRHLAVCWAVKEATYKALPTRADFTAIEFYKKDGKPCVKVEGYSALVSVSHEGSLVMASVIVYN